jgi:Adenylosuccinate synthetase (EC 6.3.4.4)
MVIGVLDIIFGGFYGDEGKGKIAAFLSLKASPSLSVRTGSINAGHTVVFNGEKKKLRIVPSSFVNKNVKLAIAPGASSSLEILINEIEETGVKNRIIIDERVGIITNEHIEREKMDSLLSEKIGSTMQGVGYAQADRVLRRLKLAKEYGELKQYLGNVIDKTIEIIEKGQKVLVEGTQGFFLSLYHGDYPYVTSRDVTPSGILSEIGVSPKYVGEIICVFKSYVTRVGNGYLPNELPYEKIKGTGMEEFGTVTGRPRRAAPFNIDLAKYVVKVCSPTQIAITKLDAIFPKDYNKRDYESLSYESKKWIEEIEEKLKVPVTIIGTGEDVMQTIDIRKEKGCE